MLVIPVYDTLILSNVQINVQEEVFSKKEIEDIKKEDNFLIVPIKEQKERGELSVDDFYDVGLLAEAISTINHEGNNLLVVDTKDRVKVHDLIFDDGRVDASFDILTDEEDISESERQEIFWNSNSMRRIW